MFGFKSLSMFGYFASSKENLLFNKKILINKIFIIIPDNFIKKVYNPQKPYFFAYFLKFFHIHLLDT